jgi:hypothetical protein
MIVAKVENIKNNKNTMTFKRPKNTKQSNP